MVALLSSLLVSPFLVVSESSSNQHPRVNKKNKTLRFSLFKYKIKINRFHKRVRVVATRVGCLFVGVLVLLLHFSR